MTSTAFRSQHQNIENAVQKLQEIIKEAGSLPREPSEATKARIKHL